MQKWYLSEFAAKAGIYLIASTMFIVFLLFLQGARAEEEAAALSAAESTSASSVAQDVSDVESSVASSAPAVSANSDASLADVSSSASSILPGDVDVSAQPAIEEPSPTLVEKPDFTLSEANLPEVDLPDEWEPFSDMATGTTVAMYAPNSDVIAAEVARLAAMGFTVPSDSPEYVGSYHTTSYCAEAYPHICGGNGVTASGTVPTPGLSVAADWSVLPSGTWIYIEDVGIRRVEDTGSAIKEKRLDVVLDTHANALAWNGFGSHNVWVLS